MPAKNLKMPGSIAVIDFGCQYSHLLTSRLRRQGVYAELWLPSQVTLEKINDPKIAGIVLSGGPQSVYAPESPDLAIDIHSIEKPILGVCYGHQWLCHKTGGRVATGKVKEYGPATVTHRQNNPLWEGIPQSSTFWMNHNDEVVTWGEGWVTSAQTAHCSEAAAFFPRKNWFAVQFHPEVTHSEHGQQLLANFVQICGASTDWNMDRYQAEHQAALKEKIGDKKVLLFVSGGVDSTVCLVWLNRILGPGRVKGLMVDTGLLRADEAPMVRKSLQEIGIEIEVWDGTKLFFERLKGVTEPEKKRQLIGEAFLEVQEQFSAENSLDDDWILAQGTIYPDTIETGSTEHSHTIKTHHNRVGAIEKLIAEGRVVEPLAELYKDEVRRLGRVLEIPEPLIERHPFPGPGLGVRILGEDQDQTVPLHYQTSAQGYAWTQLPLRSVGVQGDERTYRHPAWIQFSAENSWEERCQAATFIINESDQINRALMVLGKSTDWKPQQAQLSAGSIMPSRVALLQTADAIVQQELTKHSLPEPVWQFPVVLAPLSFDEEGGEALILRPVASVDAMSAQVPRLPDAFWDSVLPALQKIAGITSIWLDLTSKPPGTIEWE